MKINIEKTKYNHMQVMITKIIMLARLFKISQGDVLLYTKSTKVQFVVFIACFLVNKHLHIVNTGSELSTIKLEEKIGTVITDPVLNVNHLPIFGLDLSITIDSNLLFDNSKTFDFIKIRALHIIHKKEYDSLYYCSSFKDERQTLKDFILTPRNGQSTLLSIRVKERSLNYNKYSIGNMLEAVESEFGEESLKRYVNLRNTKFEESFVYMLYFFLRGDVLDVLSKYSILNNILLKSSKLKRLLFINNEGFQNRWHNNYKYKYYSRLNNFLKRWKLLNWITKYTYDKALRYNVTHTNCELVLINYNRSLDRSKFLDQAHTKISIIFGTPADGYTLGINRYDDKELKIVNNSFRIMGNSAKIEKNSLGQLLVGGERVPSMMKTKRAISVKDPKDQYYLDDHFCTIKGEILTIKADLEDIYFNSEGNAFIDVGTKRRSLMEVPFIYKVDVFKYIDDFVCVIELDNDFIKQKFENPVFTDAYERLEEKINELNANVDDSEVITKVVVSKKFFKIYDNISHIISKKNFIKYLNQQPFNYLQMLSRGESISK